MNITPNAASSCRALLVLCLALAVAGLMGCEGSSETSAQADSTGYADEMAEQHAGDRPIASPAVMEPDTAVTGRTVTYGDSLTGYMAVPEYAAADSSSESLPALIAAHEWWGLNDNTRAMARRLAGQGFRVLAIDLYGDEVGETPAQARALMQAATADQQAIQGNVEAAYRFLAGEYAAPRVGIIGWCFGGAVALNGATALPRALDAAVIYYGSLGGATPQTLRPVDMPILGFFGGQDQSIPTRRVRQFEQTLNELDKNAQIHIYDEAGHAFANPSGQSYVPSAAEDAWQKTTAFLDEYLKE
jgi:carboxymethylenebutenolidase